MTRIAQGSLSRAGFAGAALLALAACAGTVQPAAELGASREAIAAAERAGAMEHAPVELQSARTKLAAAERELQDGNEGRAQILAEQARVDAEFAGVRSQRDIAQRAESSIRSSLSGSSAPTPDTGAIGGATGSAGSTLPGTRGGTGWGTGQ
ncbi:DUF4398 domain-containing protein [Azospirillum sp. RWY-5-1]|uniref:DUF4398 domain-containing protein n=1 Tax=Azospirillum oleiclasticum TaxID=2735135 RepID=UPI0015D47451|nr:DUF4398 domain-containing protein [Azospirillum oleiclasticum]NYZ13216.1 DUF4398 domain-containing protein [Azospirillum oleiclasticum]